MPDNKPMTREEKIALVNTLRAEIAKRKQTKTSPPKESAPHGSRFPSDFSRGVNEAFSGALDTFGQAAEQFNPFSDVPFNPVAGALNTSLGISKLAGAVLSPVTQTIDRTPVLGDVQRGLTNLFNVPSEFIGGVAGDLVRLSSPVIGEERAEQIAQPAEQLAGPSALGAAGVGIGKFAKAKAPAMVENSAERIGGLVGAGESLEGMRRAGQFVAEKKISLSKAGLDKASRIVTDLNEELNTKIINPATIAGKTVNGAPVVQSLRRMREVFTEALPPDATAARAIDRLIGDTEARLSRSGGRLTPRQAQDLKTLNNKILSQHYKRIERAGGQLDPLSNVKKVGREKANAALRRALEEIDPQIKKINWTEGAGLEVSNALDRYIMQRRRAGSSLTKGAGITGAAAGNPRLAGLFAITELFEFRPFLVSFQKLRNRVGRAILGKESEFIEPGAVKRFEPGPQQLALPAGAVLSGPGGADAVRVETGPRSAPFEDLRWNPKTQRYEPK